MKISIDATPAEVAELVYLLSDAFADDDDCGDCDDCDCACDCEDDEDDNKSRDCVIALDPTDVKKIAAFVKKVFKSK